MHPYYAISNMDRSVALMDSALITGKTEGASEANMDGSPR